MDILNILWDAHQQTRIAASQAQIHATNQNVESLQDRLAHALERLDNINLVTLALWELVGERLGLTVDQLRAKVAEIDLRDGTRDGRYTGSAPRCGGCGREIAPWRQRCLFCGQPRVGVGLTDTVAPGGPTSN